jgi:rubrerythrin
MYGRLWSFLLDRGPVRGRVRDEVSRAVDRELGRAEEVMRGLRVALVQSEERNDELRRRVAELEASSGKLRTALTEQQAATEKLRRALAAGQASTERWRSAYEAAERRAGEQRAAEAELDEQTTTDLFRCRECSSLWLLSTRPDQSCAVRRPVGDGCAVCTEEPLHRLWEIKTSAAPAVVAEVPTPVSEPPEQPVTRIDTAKLAADLLEHGPQAGVAKTVAREASELLRDKLNRMAPMPWSALNAIATGLDTTPKVVRNGIAWCATEIIGLPEFPAKVLAEVVTRAALEPFQLKPIARTVRMVGTCLGDPACTRDLLRKDCEVLLADRLANVLHKLGEPGKAAEEVAKVAEDVAKTIEKLGNVEESEKDATKVATAIEEVEEAVKKLEELANIEEISSPVSRGWVRGPSGW